MLVAVAGTIATSVEVEHWGLSAEGHDEAEALARLSTVEHDRFAQFLARHGSVCDPVGEIAVLERGPAADEVAMTFEREPASLEERKKTIQVHRWARADLVAMLSDAADVVLDWVDPDRTLPSWAWWRTPREMAWHCAITECNYYLRRVGVAPPTPFERLTNPRPAPPTGELLDLLGIAQRHVETSIANLPADLLVQVGDELWTTRMVLRRLAWHERSENDVTASLISKAQAALTR